MKRLFDILLFLLLALVPVGRLYAEVTAADGRVLTEEQLDSLRQTDDFVRASLVIADPGTVLYSVLGHACIRMECATFGMDNCFSYESEDAQQKVLSFLAGKLKMGMRRVRFDEYCSLYAAEGRGVCCYRLNLSPSQKLRLWEILDQHVERDSVLPYDYYHRGCANSCVRFLHEALGRTPIEYAPWGGEPTGRDLVKESTKDALWVRFVVCFISGTEVDKPLKGERQLLIPKDLVRAWQHATVDGHVLLDSEAKNAVTSEIHNKSGWFTPLLAACLILLLVIGGWVFDYPYADWLILGIETLGGLVLTYLIFVSDLCCTSWNWMIIPFCPLPIIFWKWRKYWALPYAIVNIIWLIAVVAYPHVLVDWSHWVLVLAMVIMYIKQWKLSKRNK